MSEKYTIVSYNDSIIQCHGVYPYYEAIGRLLCIMEDEIAEWEENGYKLTRRNDFWKLLLKGNE